MAVNYNTISEKIFAVLKGSGYNVKMYSAGEGMETPDPQEAKFFYVEQPNLMINFAPSNFCSLVFELPTSGE